MIGKTHSDPQCMLEVELIIMSSEFQLKLKMSEMKANEEQRIRSLLGSEHVIRLSFFFNLASLLESEFGGFIVGRIEENTAPTATHL